MKKEKLRDETSKVLTKDFSKFFEDDYSLKYATITVPIGIRDIAHKSILLRAIVLNRREPETLSDYVRNLILADFERNKNLLFDIEKDAPTPDQIKSED